jgi:hypothetical protein
MRGLLSVILLLSCSFVLRAQSTYGTVTGTVVDASGAAEVGANVTLTNTGTSEKVTQKTGETGLYSFVNLVPGDYRLVVEKTGFKRTVRENIVVEVQQTARVDIALTVGGASETVTVTSEVPLLQAETSSLGQVVEERNADELPLNGRNVFHLVEVAPSVVMQGGAGASATGANPFSWGNFQIGGAFANQSAEYLDGQPLNIGYINLPILIPTQDSIGEFKVETNNIGPEWGKLAGGVLNISTKGGSNTFHGEGYEYIRNKVFNANDWFSNNSGIKKPPFKQNQFGANFGGRVFKDRTFFFGSYEGFRLRAGKTWLDTVPTDAVQTAVSSGSDVDLSALATALGAQQKVDSVQLYDPCSNNLTNGGCTLQTTGTNAGLPIIVGGTPFAGNVIPAARVNAAAKALMQYWPAATDKSAQVNNYASSYSGGGDQNQYLFRVDQKINDKQNIFGRYSHWTNKNQADDPEGKGMCNDACAETFLTKALALGYNYVFNPNVIGNLSVTASRFGYLRTPVNSGYDFTKLGWLAAFNDELPASERTPPTIGVMGESLDLGATQGQSDIFDHDTQFWVSPTLTLVRGRHTIQLGFQYESTLDDYLQSNIISGDFGFNGDYTLDQTAATAVPVGLADFLLGWADNPSQSVGNHNFGQATVPAPTASHQKMYAGYGNDTFHATSKLTLNLGLRYEYQSPWSERHNRITYFDPNGTDLLATASTGQNVKGAINLVVNPNRSSRYSIDQNKIGVAPRVGFAYSIDPKTVIRGGYGLFWIPLDANWATNANNDLAATISTYYTGNNGNSFVPTNTISTPWPAYIAPPGRNYTNQVEGGSPNVMMTQYNYGYTQQWNVDIQRTLWGGWFTDIAYGANKGTHLPWYAPNINQIADSELATAASQFALGNTVDIAQQVANPFQASSYPGSALDSATVAAGQLRRPFPQFQGLGQSGQGNYSSTYNSLQATLQKRFAGGGTLLAAYTWAKLLSNTDTITSWLEGGTGGTGGIQDYNNPKGEKSLSSQTVPQHLIVSYVLDLPLGKNKKYLSDLPALGDKVVSGWGIDGVTTLQTGFPLEIAASADKTPSFFGAGGIRPNTVGGCKKATSGSAQSRVKSGLANGDGWLNSKCFTTPDEYTFGNEPRVDPKLTGDGIANWDLAAFKHTTFGPGDKLGFEFRVEIFNVFNRSQFNSPSTGFGGSGFGAITGLQSSPRQIQFAGKIVF